MKTPYVYKICRSKPRLTRSSGIQLRQLHLKASNQEDAEILLLEPFFIKCGYIEDFIDTIEVYNLLDPKAAPMTIERESYNNIIHFPKIEMSGKNLYENDNRVNGQLSESVLFLLVNYSNITTVCLECVEIKPSSINTLWIKRIENRDSHFDEELFWIDRDNYILRILDKQTRRSQINHVILSQAKIIKYQHNHRFSLFSSESYGIFDEKLVMIGARSTDVSEERVFGFLSSEKEDNFKPVCFIESIELDELFINKEDIICARLTDDFTRKFQHLSIHKLLDFIDNKDQEKKIVRGKELPEFILPIIDFCKFFPN